MNENQVAGKWLELKGEIQKAWGKLTDSELEKTKGDFKAIGGLLQQTYGAAQETYSKSLKEIFSRFETAQVVPIKAAIKNVKPT